MKRHFAPTLMLVLLASILPELLSGNTPALDMLQPGMALFFIAAYGLPVLVIREFSVRETVGFGGLFLIGMAYGIVNEALLAKTVFRSTGVPVDVYDGYGFAGGIQWAWMIFILPWHALASVILPIAFAHRTAPLAAAQPWFGAGTAIVLAAALSALISLFYLVEETSGIAGTVPMLIILWGVIATLAAAARLLPGPKPIATSTEGLRPFLLGFSGIVPFVSLLATAHLRWPFFAYPAIAIGWITLYHFLIRRFAAVNDLAFGWFGFGWFAQIGVFSWLGIAAQHPYMVVVDLIVLALLWLILKRRDGSVPTGATS
jgi:hypothetical protein